LHRLIAADDPEAQTVLPKAAIEDAVSGHSGRLATRCDSKIGRRSVATGAHNRVNESMLSQERVAVF